MNRSIQSILDAALLGAHFVQRGVGVGFDEGQNGQDLRVRESRGGPNSTDGQVEEGLGRGLGSWVSVGEAGNELCLLAAQVLGEMHQTLRNDDSLAFRDVSSDEVSPAILFRKPEQQRAFSHMRDLSAPWVIVRLIDSTRPNRDQILRFSITRQSGKSRVEVHEHGSEVPKRRVVSRPQKLEDEVTVAELLPLHQLRLEVQVGPIGICSHGASDGATNDHGSS